MRFTSRGYFKSENFGSMEREPFLKWRKTEIVDWRNVQKMAFDLENNFDSVVRVFFGDIILMI